jgi:PPK2 family polyphosphate:nucleotide phosphotransferase
MTSLKNTPTSSPGDIDRASAEQKTAKYKEDMFGLQNLLFAEKKHSLLIILQGMDASGKDGTIRHVFSSVNPMGTTVKAFKEPTLEEMAHDFLWRVHQHTPPKGMIQIFNRSHYEEILVPTVHKTLPKEKIDLRYDFINSFEENLEESGTIILKFFLHISRKEQTARIKDRLTKPRKKWKYDPADKTEANNWDAYVDTYEKIFKRCGAKIPWLIVPADQKWYRNYFIARTLVETLKLLKMQYPK